MKRIFHLLIFILMASLSSCSSENTESDDENIVLYEVYSENPNQKLQISLGRGNGSMIVTGRWDGAERTDKAECDIYVNNYYDNIKDVPSEPPYYYVKVYVNGKLRTIKRDRNGVDFYIALKKTSPYWNQQKDTFLDLDGKSLSK